MTTIPRNSLFILTSIITDDDGEFRGGDQEFRIRDVLDLRHGDSVHSSPGTWDEVWAVKGKIEAHAAKVLASELKFGDDMLHAHEPDSALEDRACRGPSYDDCFPDPWAGDYAAIVKGEL